MALVDHTKSVVNNIDFSRPCSLGWRRFGGGRSRKIMSSLTSIKYPIQERNLE